MNLDGQGRKWSVTDGGHVVHERPEETCKAARSPKNSIKELNSASELLVSLKAFKEKQSGDNDSVQSVNADWNKVKVTSKVYSKFSVFTQGVWTLKQPTSI
jgi:hypothetical protein